MTADDLASMDDPTFLAERRKARERIERWPEDTEAHRRLMEFDDEFLRRARAAWKVRT